MFLEAEIPTSEFVRKIALQFRFCKTAAMEKPNNPPPSNAKKSADEPPEKRPRRAFGPLAEKCIGWCRCPLCNNVLWRGDRDAVLTGLCDLCMPIDCPRRIHICMCQLCDCEA